MTAVLFAIKEDGSTQKVPLKEGGITIGREHGCDVRLPLASVSRRHCKIDVDGSGVSVRDLGSSNGTFVNRKQVRETRASDGDLIAVGPIVFRVAMDGELGFEDPADLHQKGKPEGRGGADADASAAPATVAEPARGGDEDDPFSAVVGDDEGPSSSSDDSSFADFDFDFSDEEDLPSL